MKIFSSRLKLFRNHLGITQEQLAKSLNLETRTIVSYESEGKMPPPVTLLKIAKIFGYSVDFLILDDECTYPKNLKIVRLAKMLDDKTLTKERNGLKDMIQLLWTKTITAKVSIKKDNLDVKLSESFHENFKNIRTFREMKLGQLAEVLGISRSSVDQYETTSYPTVERLVSISGIFDCSMHALITGEMLHFDFDDSQFGDMILKADHLLTLEDHKILIRLMEALVGR